VLLAVSLIVFLMPLVAIGTLRIYESELIRRTEAELISQGAMIQAAYKQALLAEFDTADAPAGSQAPGPDTYGIPADVQWPRKVEEWLKPVPTSIDLSFDEVLPGPPDARPTDRPVDPYARAAGRRMIPQLRDAQQITLSGMQVVDYQGTVVAATGLEPGMSLAHRREVERALEGEFVQIVRARNSSEPTPPLDSISRRSDVRVFVTMPIVHQGRLMGAVLLSRTPMSLIKAVYKHRLLFGTGFAIVILAVVSISFLTSYFITQPIGALIGQAERLAVGQGDSGETIERPGTEEFARLSEAFAEMATTIEQRADYIETFARNVSHEFKTPLSSIRGTVELLRDHWETMEEAKREEFLEMVDKDRRRLQMLVERLLDLARADMLEPAAESADLLACIERAAGQVGDGLEVTVEGPDEGLEAAMGRQVVESIMANLLENARQHGATRAAVTIESSDEEAVVTVHDDGPGISEGNADKIFDAFFTTARSEGGTGLGLAIVRSLLEAHGGTIELVDVEEGAAFAWRVGRAGGEGEVS
jgi:signal transduction histidine kinase